MDQPVQLDIDDTTLDATIDRLFSGFVTGTFTIVPATAASDMTGLSGGLGESAATQHSHGQAIPPTSSAPSQRASQVSQCEQSTAVTLQTTAPFGQTWDTAREQMLIDVLSVVANPVSSGAALSSLQPEDRAQTSQPSLLTEDPSRVLCTNMALSGFNDPAQSSTCVSQQNLDTTALNSGSNLPAFSQLAELIQDYERPAGANGDRNDTGQDGSMSCQSSDALETVQLHDIAMLDNTDRVTEENGTDQCTPHHASGTSCQTRSQTRNKLRRTRSRVSESSVDDASQEFKEYLKTLPPEERKRELNRRAAKRCRDKKYEKELELEAKAKQLREQRTELLREKAQLQEQSNSIASNLRQHSFCQRH
ncbi:uncharacterized protein LOC124284186 [Haliotis rubra]|uniref:uncharacterized protein LOC124284186 n=1 Tax=Haliotis rubra TaxID=36100 RepID=UPI001EE5CFFE|nr:uncharacterized protein LOC124284186 [Haliotis rubra]XP_046576204.1 uncharacterized protein LOC124284186 [Haliotis rubra]